MFARRIEEGRTRAGEPRALEVSDEPTRALQLAVADAVERGYQDGLAAGRADAAAAHAEAESRWRSEADETLAGTQAELAAVRDSYLSAVTRLAREIDDDRLWAESMAVEVAFAAVTRWIGAHRLDERTLEQLCTEVMRDYPRAAFTVRVSPADAALLNEAGTTLTLLADPSLADGDLHLDSPRGGFDAGIRARLDALRDALLAGLTEARPRD